VFIGVYNTVCDIFYIERLRGKHAIWDINYASLLYVLQFGIFHFYDYHLQLKVKQQKENELQQLRLQSEIQLLKAQIEPHFLFNTLNSISASVPKENEKTRILISKLADTFRYALEASKEEFTTLKKELSFIKTYLLLEKERFEDNLEIKYLVDEFILDAQIPVMLLQPLLKMPLSTVLVRQQMLG
jgi:two-component system, LytTR family, sensor kinase